MAGRPIDSGTQRIYRGGDFGGIPLRSRSACRHATDPQQTAESIGFRVVLPIGAE